MKKKTVIAINSCAWPVKARFVLSTCLFAIALPLAGWGEPVNIIGFDLPGSNGTFPSCVNERGMVVGDALTVGVSYNVFIRDRDGSYTTFALPGSGSGTGGFGINYFGAVIGTYADSEEGAFHGLLRTPDGDTTTIDYPGAATGALQGTSANNINAFGTIAGYYSDANTVTHGFLRRKDGKFVTFDGPNQAQAQYHGVLLNSCGALNDAGEVTGYSLNTDGLYHGFVRDSDGRVSDIMVPGAQGTFAMAINAVGVVAGFYNDSQQVSHGFVRLRNGSFVTVDVRGAGTTADAGTSITSINALGDVTGYYLDSNYVYHGFVRRCDGRISIFNAPEAGTIPPQGTLPYSINTRGEITGQYLNSGVGEELAYHGFVSSR
ncbi:MAG: hypothetical protein WA510_04655 [Acidobacteriaceae bacterium]